MTNAAGPTLAEINAQIQLLEVVEQFGSEVQEFTDWLGTLSGADLSKWLSDDSTVQFVFDGLKDAAFEFSETLGGAAEHFEPLTDAAGAAGNINTAVQTATSIVTIIEDADSAVGPDKATQLSGLLSNLTSLSQLLTGLSLNPVIGVFLGLYATALESAAIGLQLIDESVQERNEAIDTRGGEIDVEAELAAEEAAADQAAEAQLALSEELSRLYELRAELIIGLQDSQYTVALDFAASRHPEAMTELIEIASEQGGIPSNAPVNGDTLGQLESWVGSATTAAFDLMTEAAAAPEGSEARADATGRLEDLMDAKGQVIGLLGPIRGTVTGALEEYGYSTADPGTPAAATPTAGGVVPGGAVVGGAAGFGRGALLIGGGIAALVLVGVVALFAGGGDGTNGDGNGSSAVSNDGSSSGSSGSGGSSSSGSSSSGGSSGGAAAPSHTACELRREERIVLEFSSPEFQPGIPDFYQQSNAYENGFPTPAFEWSSVPPEATELAIVVYRLTDERASLYMGDPELLWNLLPVGQQRWVISGIDPTSTSFPASSLSNPLPVGVVAHEGNNPTVTVNDESDSTQFVGPSGDQYFVFLLMALCEAPHTVGRLSHPSNLRNDAVAMGWFIASR